MLFRSAAILGHLADETDRSADHRTTDTISLPQYRVAGGLDELSSRLDQLAGWLQAPKGHLDRRFAQVFAVGLQYPYRPMLPATLDLCSRSLSGSLSSESNFLTTLFSGILTSTVGFSITKSVQSL